MPRDEDLTPQPPIRPFQRQSTATYSVAEVASSPLPAPVEIMKSMAGTACDFCLQTGCITLSAFKPMGRGHARRTNHNKRRKDYKWFWRTIKDCGLWENPTYLARKEELGCMIDDVREGYAALRHKGRSREVAKSSQCTLPRPSSSVRFKTLHRPFFGGNCNFLSSV